MASRFFHPPESAAAAGVAIFEFGAAKHQLDARVFLVVIQVEIRESSFKHGDDGVARREERILRDVGQAGLLAQCARCRNRALRCRRGFRAAWFCRCHWGRSGRCDRHRKGSARDFRTGAARQTIC